MIKLFKEENNRLSCVSEQDGIFEKIEKNKKQIELLKAKYDIDTDRAEYDWEQFYKENPEIKQKNTYIVV